MVVSVVTSVHLVMAADEILVKVLVVRVVIQDWVLVSVLGDLKGSIKLSFMHADRLVRLLVQ